MKAEVLTLFTIPNLSGEESLDTVAAKYVSDFQSCKELDMTGFELVASDEQELALIEVTDIKAHEDYYDVLQHLEKPGVGVTEATVAYILKNYREKIVNDIGGGETVIPFKRGNQLFISECSWFAKDGNQNIDLAMWTADIEHTEPSAEKMWIILPA